MPRSSHRPVYCIRDAALEVLDSAVRALQGGLDDANIHNARKACKRARAALRLLRKSLGKRAYDRENRALRDAAKPLTAIRDAFVLRKTLRSLPPHSAKLDLVLVREYQQARSGLESGNARVALKLLRRTRDRLAKQKVAAPEHLSAAAGLTRSYRAGVKASRAARSRDDVALHEWRKQTKYLLNQLELMKVIFRASFGKMRLQADELAGTLGDDHDLCVLLAKLRGNESCDATLIKELKTRRQALQAQALRLEKKLYRHSAAHVQAKSARKLLAAIQRP